MEPSDALALEHLATAIFYLSCRSRDVVHIIIIIIAGVPNIATSCVNYASIVSSVRFFTSQSTLAHFRAFSLRMVCIEIIESSQIAESA